MLTVLGFTAFIGIAALILFGANAGLWSAFAALLMATMVTVPNDLQDGEYDLFGLAVLGCTLVLGLIAMVIPQASPRFSVDAEGHRQINEFVEKYGGD